MKMTKEYTITLPNSDPDDANDVDVEFEIEADMVYEPEYIGGSPEDSHPDESKSDITSVKALTEVSGWTSDQLAEMLGNQCGDKVDDDLWEEFHEQRSSHERDDPRDD